MLIVAAIKGTMKKLSKPLLILTILTLLFASCSNDIFEHKKDVTVNSLEEALTNLSQTAQTFQIDPTEEIMLKGDKGTAVYIPANAFHFSDGTTPTGSVNIELKECYSLTDMVANNLNTMSEHGILETGGMIYVNATADGKELSVKEGKAFVIGFPKDNSQSEEMDLFYEVALNETSPTWVADYKMFEAEAIQRAQADTTSNVEDAALIFEYPIEMTDDLYDYGYDNSLTTATFYQLKLKGEDRTILDYINDPSNTDSIDARAFSENRWCVNFEFNIDQNGVMQNFRIVDDEYTKYNDRAVQIALEFLKSSPPFDLASYDQEVRHDWDYALGIKGTRSINWDRFKVKFRAKYAKYKDKAIQQMEQNALDYYMFSATKLGWINCDRFWDLDEEEKTDFFVTTPAPKDTKIQIIFKDINSILTGRHEDGKLVFNNVPLGRNVKVIGISYAYGKPTLGVAETTIDQDGFELNAFNEFSLDELEKVLNEKN